MGHEIEGTLFAATSLLTSFHSPTLGKDKDIAKTSLLRPNVFIPLIFVLKDFVTDQPVQKPKTFHIPLLILVILSLTQKERLILNTFV